MSDINIDLPQADTQATPTQEQLVAQIASATSAPEQQRLLQQLAQLLESQGVSVDDIPATIAEQVLAQNPSINVETLYSSIADVMEQDVVLPADSADNAPSNQASGDTGDDTPTADNNADNGSEITTGAAQGANDEPAEPTQDAAQLQPAGSTLDNNAVADQQAETALGQSEPDAGFATQGQDSALSPLGSGIFTGSVLSAEGGDADASGFDSLAAQDEPTLDAPEVTGLSLDSINGNAGTSSNAAPTEVAQLTSESGEATNIGGGALAGSTEGTLLTDNAPAPTQESEPEAEADATDLTGQYFINALDASVYEGASGVRSMDFVVTRTNPVADARLNWSLQDQFDAHTASGEIFFRAGSESETIQILVDADKDIEADAVYTINLTSSDGNVDLVSTTASTQLIDDDATVSISVDQAVIEEGTSGESTILTYTVTRSKGIAESRVDWSADGLSVNDLATDQALSGQIVFADGETTKTFTIEVAGDRRFEHDELLNVTLSNPGNNLNLGENIEAQTTVRNDDGIVSIEVSQASVSEGTSGTQTTLTYTATRTKTDEAQSVNWVLSGVTADDLIEGQDLSGLLEFAIGEATTQFEIVVTGDKSIEADESLKIDVRYPNEASLADTSTSIINDDSSMTISVEQASIVEGSTGETTTLTYTISRSVSSPIALGPTSVDWALTGIDAEDMVEGQLTSGSLIFLPGVAEQEVVVEIKGDKDIEDLSNLVVTLSNPGDNLELADINSATAQLIDDDGLMAISVSPVSINEGDEGETQDLVYTITRENAAAATTVDWAFSGIEAERFPEGTALSGELEFAVGELSKTVTLSVIGDKVIEEDESWTLTISNPGANTTLQEATSSATASVLDDDALVSIAATQVSIDEGQDGEITEVVFKITRTSADEASDVSWSVAGGEVDAEDFVDGALPSGVVSFAQGETEKFVTLEVKGDRTLENDETLVMQLDSVTGNANLGVTTAETTINTDEIGFGIYADNVNVIEGDSNATTAITFHVVRSSVLDQATQVDYSLIPIGANGVDASDFVAGQDNLDNNGGRPSGTIEFEAGQESKSVTIYVQGDSIPEVSEDFSIVLNNAPVDAQIIFGEISGQIQLDEMQYAIQTVEASTMEGTGDGNTVQFVITREGNSDLAGSVGYQVSGLGENPANAADFAGGVFPSGTVNFAEGESTKIIEIELNGDTDIEGYEAFAVTLEAQDDNTLITTSTATHTINPDDATITIEATNSYVKEGSDVVREHSFTVTRAEYEGSSLTVNWAVVGDNISSVDAADFGGEFPSGQLTFEAGETEKVITFAPNPDVNYENNERYNIVLTQASDGYVFIEDTASGMILNDDTALTLQATDLVKKEGDDDANPQTITFTVQRTGNLYSETSVDWNLIPNEVNGVSSDDFVDNTDLSGTLTFGIGQQSLSVTLELKADSELEVDKGFSVQLSNPVPAVGTELLVDEVVGGIINDDVTFALQPLTSVSEGDAGTKAVSLTVLRSGDLSGSDSVEYALSEVSGISADDFVGGVYPSGTLAFIPGQESASITFNIVADSVLESDETFAVTLSNPSAGSTISSEANTTNVIISNDDDVLSITAADASKNEGANGTETEFTFTISRTGYTDKETSISWAIPPAAGISAEDFVGDTSGTVDFASGSTSETITVTVKGDYKREADETFQVQLSDAPAGTQFSTSSAQSTIVNDDTGLVISATTTSLSEGDSGTQTHTFTVTRTGILTGSTTVDWALADITTDSSDYTGATSGSLSFASGEDTKTIQITTTGDTDLEDNETFSIDLSNASGNTDIETASATGIIQSDDIEIAIEASEVSVAEGATGSNQIIEFVVTRSGDLTSAVSVNWAATGIDADDVFGSQLSGQLDFASNQTSKTISLNLKGDNSLETDETISVNLTKVADDPLADKTYITTSSAQTVVTNDDVQYSINMTPANIDEGSLSNGDGETTDYTFTVTRNSLDTSATVNWSLALTGGTDVASLSDFVEGQDTLTTNNGLPSGTLVFADDALSAEVTVQLLTDEIVEPDESFTISLSTTDPDNVDLSAGELVGSIDNDDSGFAIYALDSEKAEGSSGTTMFTFNIVRAGDLSQAATIDWAVSSVESAGEGEDTVTGDDFTYVGEGWPNGTLNIPANSANTTLSIEIDADTASELDENFVVNISNAVLVEGGVISISPDANSAAGTIINDDQNFVVTTSNTNLLEDDSGQKSIIYTITRDGDTSQAVDIDYAVTGGAGVNSADTTAALPSGQLHFDADETTQTVTVTVKGDNLGEGDEAYTLTVSNPTAGTIVTDSATTTITNDDTSYSVSAPVAAFEGDTDDTTNFTFTITRSGKTTEAGSVSWSMNQADGWNTTDISGSTVSGTVDFSANQTVAYLTIPVLGDRSIENDEPLSIRFSNPSDGIFIDSNGNEVSNVTLETTVKNDDDSFSISANTSSTFETHAEKTVTYTVNRSGSLEGERALTWTITGVDAQDLADDQAMTGTVSFADGDAQETIQITLKGDTSVEDNEDLTVTLSNPPANSIIGSASAQTEIINDDATVSISAVTASRDEGSTGSYVDYQFTVTRTGYTSQSSSVSWNISGDVTADDFYDGTVPHGTVNFSSGDTTETITVRMRADSTLESNENLTVDISNPSTGTIIGTASATSRIDNDDAQLNITAGTASQLEGDGGTDATAYTYTVTRTGNLNQTTTVDWYLSNGTTNYYDFGDGSNEQPDGSLTFTSGEATKTFTVYVNGDTGSGSVEDDETFSVHLTNPNNGSLIGTNSSYNSTILNDDTRLILSVDDYSQAEEKSGGSTTYNYSVEREGYIDRDTTFTWSTTTASSDVHDNTSDDSVSDYYEDSASSDDISGGFTSGNSVTMASGDADAASFSVTVIGDDNDLNAEGDENDEWFDTYISASQGYDEIYVKYDDPNASTGTSLLRANSSGWRYYLDNQAQYSGTSSAHIYSEIVRDEAIFYLSDREVADESVETLSPGNDLYRRTESDSVADSSASEKTVTIDGVEYNYLEHIFAVQRQVATAGDASVGWRVDTYSTSVSANDFVIFGEGGTASIATELPSGTVTFADGQEWGYVKFYTLGDNEGENDESFRVYLENASAGSSIYEDDDVSSNSYNLGVIDNDDTRFDVSVPSSTSEGNTITFTIKRDGDDRGTDTVDWKINFTGSETTYESTNDKTSWYELDPSDVNAPVPANGTATYDEAGSYWSGTLTFADGETEKTITMQTINDSWPETWKENIGITLSNADNIDDGESNHDDETAFIGVGSDTINVLDNDIEDILTLSVDKTSVWEGTADNAAYNDDNVGNSVTFTITRAGTSEELDYSATVGWYLSGSYINRSDYGNVQAYTGQNHLNKSNSSTVYGNVYFAAEETTQQVTITFNGDDFVEGDQNITFNLVDASTGEYYRYNIGDGYGTANTGSDTASAPVISQTVTVKNDDIRLWVDNWTTSSTDNYGRNITVYEEGSTTFDIVRTGNMDEAITLNYAISNGSTTNSDFDSMSGTFTLEAGQDRTTISLADIINQNDGSESTENFTLTLTAPSDTDGSSVRFQSDADGTDAWSNAYSNKSSTLDLNVTLKDTDPSYTLTPQTATTLEETDSGSDQTFSFKVTRDASSDYTENARLYWKVEAVGSDPVNTSDFSTGDSLGNNGGLPSGSVYFSNDELSDTFNIVLSGDNTVENNEQFRVVLYEDVLYATNPDVTNTYSVASANLTVKNDDTGISIADNVITESDSNQTMTFTVTRTGDLTSASSMTWTLNTGTAASADFSGSTTGTLTFDANNSGDTSETQDITITVAGDITPEQAENFTLVLSDFTNVNDLIDTSATGTIKNDDSSFTLTAGSAANEGDAQTFTVTRTHLTEQAQTIDWSVSDIENSEFNGSLPSGSVTFGENEYSKTFTVTSHEDSDIETTENFTVTITGGSGTTGDVITVDSVQGTILDDDVAFSIAADTNDAKAEGQSGTTPFTFTVNAGKADAKGSVNWKLSGNGDITAADFATADDLNDNSGLPSGTLTFDGEQYQTITILVNSDWVKENDETFTITLSDAASSTGGSATISTATAMGEITNDDSSLAIAVTDAVKAEGDSGTTDFTFTVTRTGNLSSPAQVTYTITGSGDHPADSDDFAQMTGTLVLPSVEANSATETITVQVDADTAAEFDEGFTVTLSNPSTGMNITQATAQGTIQTDDVAFAISAQTTPDVEGNPDEGGTSDFVFEITRSGKLDEAQTIHWVLEGTGANPITTSGDESDLQTGTPLSGDITFAADGTTTSQLITIPVKKDYLVEGNESLRITISEPANTENVHFTNTYVDAVIVDDETAVNIAFNDSYTLEGHNGAETTYEFTISRVGNTALGAEVDWTLVLPEGVNVISAEEIKSGQDVLGTNAGLPSGHVSFAEGDTDAKTISVTVLGDIEVEADEIFNIQIATDSIGHAAVTDTAVGTVVSDDLAWSVEATSIPTEGDTDTAFVFTVSRTGSLAATTVDWAVVGSGVNAATADDFKDSFFPDGTLTFAKGQASQTFTVNVAGDDDLEVDEGFTVSLTAPVDSLTHTYTQQSVDAVIANDDDVMSISAVTTDLNEGYDNGTTAFTFNVLRTGSTDGNSTVGWRIVHGDTTDDDFAVTSGVLTFTDGMADQDFVVNVIADRLLEDDESFSVELYNPGDGSTIDTDIAKNTAQGVIRNDDVDLTLSTTPASTVVEGDQANAGRTAFTVTRSGDLSGVTTVDYQVVAGSATAADFDGGVLPSGSLTFEAGEDTLTFYVDLAGDGIDEGNETFSVQLSNPSSEADIAVGTVSGGITDDDDTLTVTAVSVPQYEANTGTTSFMYRIDRSGTTTGEASVDWSVTGTGTHATDSTDFAATTGTVNFAAGESSKVFTVEVSGDLTGEYDETFNVSLSNPSYGSTATAITAAGTILNDDPVLSIVSDAVSSEEGPDGVEKNFTFTVTRGGNTTGSSTALWTVVPSGDHPANAMDFGGYYPSGIVGFGSGDTEATITVAVLGDDTGEFDEGFSVVLSEPEGADILEGTASTIISNDDTGISIYALDAEKSEGDVGETTTFTFRVERVGDLSEATVTWAVDGYGAYPAGADDFAGGVLPTGTINFAQDETYRDIELVVAGDNESGYDQNFRVTIDGDNLVQSEAIGIINNDDSVISIDNYGDATIIEGDNGGYVEFQFVVTRTGATNKADTVDWEVVGSGGHPADADDFVGGVLPTGTVSFASGETSKIVTVQVASDDLTEVDETFDIELTNPSKGASLSTNDSVATATITTDDDGIVLLGLDIERYEGEEGAETQFTYQILRSGNTDSAISINYVIAGDINQDDLSTPLEGVIEMGAGVNSQEFVVTVKGDEAIEGDEEFQITLSGEDLNIDSTPVTSTILADEQGLRIEATEVTVNEGSDGGTTAVTFNVIATGITENTDVAWEIVSTGGTDVFASDFGAEALPSGSLNFTTDGTQSFTVNLDADSRVELDELITAKISSTATMLDSTAQTQIIDDDEATAEADVLEGNNQADTLTGLAGNDVLLGFDGGDSLYGADGDDTLNGGEGTDVLVGGNGTDTFVFDQPSDGMDVIQDFSVADNDSMLLLDGFTGLNSLASKVETAFDTDVTKTIEALAAQADSDLYSVQMGSDFSFESGADGNLDELETAITNGDHTGSALFLISNGAQTRVYYDADTNSGDDGSGLIAVAEMTSVADATTVTDSVVVQDDPV